MHPQNQQWVAIRSILGIFTHELQTVTGSPIQEVKMTMDVHEEYDMPPHFDFAGPATCDGPTVCLKVTQEYDSIIFDGKLNKVPTEYAATLKDSKQFTFIFGEKPMTPRPTETTPAAVSTPVGESTTSDPNDETLPTTSSGQLNLASVALILLPLVFMR